VPETPTILVRDGLLRPGPAVTSRTFVKGVAAVVTGERTYRLQEYHHLYQTKMQYEIFNTDTGGVESQIELTKVYSG